MIKGLHIAFIVDRLGQFKACAPLIHEALRRGYGVTCWLNHRDISQTTKWYDFPAFDAVPLFGNLKPNYAGFKTSEELEALNNNLKPDLVFSLFPPKFKKWPNQKWAHIVTAFADSQCSMNPSVLSQFDYIFNDTKHWVEEGFRIYEISNRKDVSDDDLNLLKAKFLSTGIPQYDHFDLITKEEAKKQLGIPRDKKVVTVFKFEVQAGFWSNKIFHEPSLLKRLFNVFFLPATYPNFFSRIGKAKLPWLIVKSLKDRLKYFPEVFRSPSEKDVLEAIRQFCDKNGYFLVMKYRKKNPLKPYQMVADLTVADESLYPYTASVAIKASDLMITLFSCAAAEGAYAGVPVINLGLKDMDLFYKDQYILIYKDGAHARAKAEQTICYNTNPSGLFNTPGAVYNLNIYDFPKEFPYKAIDDFPADIENQKAYVKKLIKPTGRSSSAEILDKLEMELR